MAVTAFIPIVKLKKAPIELIKKSNIAPITPFIINFINILNGQENILTINTKPNREIKKYPIYSTKSPLANSI